MPNRYYCLRCGHFWTTDSEPTECPRCGVRGTMLCWAEVRRRLEEWRRLSEERIAKHEKAMRVLASIDRGMGMEDDGCLCGQCSRRLDCLLR